MRKAFVFTLIVLLAVANMVSNSGCATIIPPEGGPRDTLPPVLLRAEPADSSVNFKGRRITLNFDEYVDLQEIQENLLFTPVFQETPRVSVRLRTITVGFADTLEPNTTYTLNFGNAIRDINENNISRNFVYTFSTGPALDSLEFAGRVILAETGRIDTTLMVMLYRNLNDSAVLRERPRYITRLDRNGNFLFSNLPAGVFKVYAMGGTGTRRRYNTNDLFAFHGDSIIVGQTDSVALYAYKETGPTQVQPPSPNTPAARSGVRDRLRYTPNITGTQLELQKNLTLSFPAPLKTFDTTQMELSTDSVFNRTSFSAALDTSRKIITVSTQWKENTLYNLILTKDFAEDTAGKRLLKSDTLRFTTKKQSDYGQINIRIKNIDNARNPVLLFVQNDQVVFSTRLQSGTFTSNLFVPGDYDLRILYDANGNGKWDPGQFFGTKKQPELVQPIEQKITVKPAWQNEYERSL